VLLDIDARGRVTFCSQRASEWFGSAPNQCVGRPFADVVGSSSCKRLARPLATALAGRPATIEVELDADVRRYVHASFSPRPGEHGEPAGCIALLTDVSERQRELQRQRFLADASSTLASPLEIRSSVARVARQAVPSIADWSGVYLGSEGVFERIAFVHRESDVAARLIALEERADLQRLLEPLLTDVLNEGHGRIIQDLGADLLARSDGVAPRSRLAELRGCVIAPMIARGKGLGVMLLGLGPGGAPLDRSSVAFAEDVAHRVAVASRSTTLVSMRKLKRRATKRRP
jgi:PAS domain S-box-containing protein